MPTTETVTLLFCDLVGSTALLSRLGDDANDALRRELFGALRDPVARHRGHEVKSQGDGLMVVFRASAADAVACAVEMQRRVHRLDRREPMLGLAIRVGLSLGEATFEEDDWFGTPVVEAARLCARAGPRQILATELLRGVLGSRGGFDLTPVGAMELKGFPVAVETCEVGWEPDAELPEVPLPAALDHAGVFVGRTAELAALEAAWRGVRAGAGGALLVSGPAGCGKTDLVRRLVSRCQAEGAVVLYGTGGAAAASLAGPLAEAVRWYAAASPPEVLREQLGANGDALLPLVPALRGRLPELRERPLGNPEAERARQVGALRDFLARAASSRPVVLVLDDLHACPPATRALVGAALAPVPPPGVLLIGCARDDAADVAEWLPGVDPLEVVALGGLEVEDIAALTASSGWPILGADQLAVLREQTGGSPLAVLEVLSRLDTAATPSLEAAIAATCPYRGLMAFGADDAEVFFGREEVVAALLARLGTARLLAVVGASGSGKSSVLRAGLLPAIHGGALQASEHWRVVLLTPGPRPLTELAATLALERETSAGAVLAALSRGDPEVLASTAAARLVVVVDQFEELFTLCDDATERSCFIDALVGAATRPSSGTMVLLALRADFYGHCAASPALAAALESHHVLLGPMRDDELRRAIEGPAHYAGLEVEAGFTALALADVANEPGALPLLSHALLETWRRRQGRTLTVSGYQAAGGVRAAIARTADDVYASLDVEAQRLARGVFLRLTELGEGTEDTRRRVHRAELLPEGSDAVVLEGLLEQLTTARLIIVGDDTVEVAHEALIREWPRLRGWLDDDREALRTLRHLTSAAHDWDERGRAEDDVYRGPRLAAATELAARPTSALTPVERAFLDAGRARQEHDQHQARRQVQRLRRLLAAALVAVLVAATASVLAIGAAQRARVARNDADLRSLVAESRALVEENRSVSMLLAVEAHDRRDDAASRDALLRAVVAEPRLRATFGPLGGIDDAGVLADGRRVVESHAARFVQVWDRVTGKKVRSIVVPGGRVSALAVSPDGERFALGTPDGSLHVYSASTYKRQGPPIATGMTLGYGAAWLAFSPDGRWIAVANGSQGDRARVRTQETVKLFRLADHRQGPPLSGHENHVSVVAFSADSATLATGATDNTVVLHDVATGTTRATISTAVTPSNLALDPRRPRLIVVGLADTGTAAYDTVTGEPLASSTGLPGGQPFFDRAGNRLGFWGDETLQLVDPTSYEPIDPTSPPIRRQGGPVGAPIFLPDGEILLAGSTSPMTVWDAAGTSRLQELVPGYPGGLYPTPDPHILVGTDLGRSFTLLDAGTLQPLGPPIVVDATEGPYSTLVVFDPSGKRLAAVGPTGGVTFRTFPRGRLLRTAQIPRFSHSVAWRPDGQQIAFGAYDGGITLVDPDTGEVRKVRRTGTNLVSWPGYRPDGRELLVSDLSGNVAVITRLDEATPKVSKTERFGLALTVAFTADGRSLVAMRPGQVQVYDAVTLTPRAAPVALKTGYLLTLSADGRFAAINDLSDHMRIVDLDAGRPIGPPLPIGALSGSWFTHDGNSLLTSAPNGGARWSIDPRRWRNEACALAGRNLTETEWHRYLPNAGTRHATCPDHPLL